MPQLEAGRLYFVTAEERPDANTVYSSVDTRCFCVRICRPNSCGYFRLVYTVSQKTGPLRLI